MKGRVSVVGLAAIVLAVAGVVAYKQYRKEPLPAQPARVAASKVSGSSAVQTTSVLLFADLGEANDDCGCGRIIRAVRSAAGPGVAIREFDAGKGGAVAKDRRVTVEPTVLILDSSGREVARHEGESAETIATLEKDLGRFCRRTR